MVGYIQYIGICHSTGVADDHLNILLSKEWLKISGKTPVALCYHAIKSILDMGESLHGFSGIQDF